MFLPQELLLLNHPSAEQNIFSFDGALFTLQQHIAIAPEKIFEKLQERCDTLDSERSPRQSPPSPTTSAISSFSCR